MCQPPELKKEMSSSSSAASSTSNSSAASTASVLVTKDNIVEMAPTHSEHKRNTKYDWLLFLGPALFCQFTDVKPIYAVALTRFITVHVILALHWKFVDFDNYLNKLTQKQILREKDDFTTAFFLHMWIQLVLQFIFPSMFFSDASQIAPAIREVVLAHVLVVEPVYYYVHRWLHVPQQMKTMHGFHHLSINTLPTTALVQNFNEHIVYVITFAPAFFLPFFIQGRHHWVAIGFYLVAFDIINTFGHTNLKIRNGLFTSKYSPLHYLFYTPEFHLGHHAYFNANYTLFMPIWDYLGGTARDYRKNDLERLLPASQQDFVFIGHNGGLGHLFTIPELCVYNVYDTYIRTWLPVKLEFLIVHLIARVYHLFLSFYYCSRFCIANDYIGRIIVLVRTPWDYMNPKSYKQINREIVDCMRTEHKRCGTRYFGLGNLNKMKQLNDGGIDIVKLVEQDDYLKDKSIRVWTGDTMTVASVYHQIADIPDLDAFYYIGAGGKVGTAVCQMLVRSKPNMKIRIFSRNQVLDHPNISYSTDLSEVCDYKVVLVGKILSPKMYDEAFRQADPCETRFVLDYTVPAMKIESLYQRSENIQHIRIGLLHTKQANNPFLKGHYDLCMSHDENHIVPCHFGCILNSVCHRETNEVGDIDLQTVDQMWKMTTARGFQNIEIDYSCE